jgi:hypothetical protein
MNQLKIKNDGKIVFSIVQNALIGETHAHECDGIKRCRYDQNDPKDHGYPPPSMILTPTYYIRNILALIQSKASISYAMLTSK